MFKKLEEQIIFAHKMIDVTDGQKTHVILQRFIMDKPETSYAQVGLFAWKWKRKSFK